MMVSMFSAVSGLRNHQKRMDIIGNNIANINTTSFKSSRVTFQDAYSQIIQGATQASTTTGGVNPKQVGLGMQIGSIDVMTSRGAMQSTGRPMDLFIGGDGYFLAETDDTLLLTRAGNFSIDSAGNVVNSSGLKIMGWDRALMLTDPDGTGSDFSPINILNAGESTTDYSNLTIDQNGLISGLNLAGNTVELGRIALCTVPNSEGLTQMGSSMYQASGNSGPMDYTISAPGVYTMANNVGDIKVGLAGDGTVGDIVSGVLEMSNVDMAEQMTDMIITQRGFQANSSVITVSDEMLQDLVNLKR